MKFRGQPLTEDDREHINKHILSLLNEIQSMRRIVYHIAPEGETELADLLDLKEDLEQTAAGLEKLLSDTKKGLKVQASL